MMTMAVPVMAVMAVAVSMPAVSMATMAFGECRRHKHQRGCQARN
jgi:hypothetical protein